MCKLYINNYTQLTNLFSTCVQHMDIFLRRGETNQPHGLSGKLHSFRLSPAEQVQAAKSQSNQLAQTISDYQDCDTVQASLCSSLCKHYFNAHHCASIIMLSTFQIAYSKQCKRHHAHHCVGTIIPITVQASTCSALHTLLKVMMCMADSQFATTPIGHTNDYSHDGKIVITTVTCASHTQVHITPMSSCHMASQWCWYMWPRQQIHINHLEIIHYYFQGITMPRQSSRALRQRYTEL
jgi:hypothetical protein